MKKGYKIAIILLIVGIVLCGIGYSMGANMGIYMDSTGFHTTPKTQQTYQQNFNQITSINVISSNQKIEIQSGDSYSIEAQYTYNCPEITFENGALTVDSKNNNNPWFQIGSFLTDKITITLPENIQLASLSTQNDNGSITIDNPLNAQNFNVKNDNGTIKISDITSDNATIKNGNGSINLTNFITQSGTITNSNGSITATNIEGKNTFTNENGSINISAYNLSDFYKQLSNENGSIRIDGQKPVQNVLGDPTSPNQIIATNQNGSIKLFDLGNYPNN